LVGTLVESLGEFLFFWAFLASEAFLLKQSLLIWPFFFTVTTNHFTVGLVGLTADD
jgi:hypothetical protein